MILEPRKSADEIEKRLAALNDPELTELLRRANPNLITGAGEEVPGAIDPPDNVPETAPFWRKRRWFFALAGLLAMAAGYASSLPIVRHDQAKIVPVVTAPAAPMHRHVARTLPRPVPVRHRAAARHAAVIAAPVLPHSVSPSASLLNQARAEIAHERSLAQRAQMRATVAEHRAVIATQAQERAQSQFLAQARAQALAQARAQAQAQSQAQAQANAEALDRAQEQARANAQDPNIKPGEAAPPTSDTGGIATYPTSNNPIPASGPVDTNCTPSRGSIFRGGIHRLHIGGTVGGLLRLIP